ncbi:penicillinase repressor [Prauserella marina]|uniref:Predicted transcriptional regulator n=1 Tax=Prauserella marina TaxID=530584 RepID=A0A222VP91_9PSEU|nr:BlaI/MecI/CopY family transcriptional regulator [Prauserella marina]ASR35727.1 penicillinase repressor [Prauserella marina]PWV84390.1 putative transcriptional regulator [Prauserella marina]SDC23784.1 Predicted transcriptional regulator [Prauserella marina]
MRGLGELESAVMNVLWEAGEPVRVRDVLERLDTGKPLAYTTVMTVLDNLHRKGWTAREQHGKAYHYTPASSREEASTRALREVLGSSADPEAVLLHFVASVSDEETELLRGALRKKRPHRR